MAAPQSDPVFTVYQVLINYRSCLKKCEADRFFFLSEVIWITFQQ